MDNVLFLDIETIPAQSMHVIKKIRNGITPPGSIKKDESIKKWYNENLDAATDEALAKTSIDPALGHICTISWAIDDEEPDVAHAERVEDEAGVLRAFFSSMQPNHRYQFVGHYIGGFDIRFILCRAVVRGIPIPRAIPRDPKPWDSHIFDTMTAWAGQRGTISLDNLSAALGLEGKGNFDGSMVAEAWKRGEHEIIAAYCADDVRRTREIWRKFQAANW